MTSSFRSCFIFLAALGGCSSPNGNTAPVPYVADPIPWLSAPTSHKPEFGATGVRKLCQLIGDQDLGRGVSVGNLTSTRYGVAGTDLGISIERNGELLFLFGDTWNADRLSRRFGSDSFATLAAGGAPEDACSSLRFATSADGGFAPITLDGAPLPEFQVPTGGFSTVHSLYVFFTVADDEGRTIGNGGGRGVLARSSGDGNFTRVREISPSGDRFNMVAAADLPLSTRHPLPGNWEVRDVVLLYGTGRYRESFPRLAFAQKNHPEVPWLYFAGYDAHGAPDFSVQEESAMPLFPDNGAQACVGEMSVAWAPHIERWLMTYNCRGKIQLRSAPLPWGPWSTPITLFDKHHDTEGLLHHACGPFEWPCGDDNYSPTLGPKMGGDPYAPYLVPSYFSAAGPDAERIVFTLSTWNPYVAVLMDAVVRK